VTRQFSIILSVRRSDLPHYFGNRYSNRSCAQRCPLNHLSFNTVCRRWTFRPGLLEWQAKGPLGHSNQRLEARKAIKGGWISSECDRHLKSINIFCYCLLGVRFSPLTGFFLHFFLPCCSTHTTLTDWSEDWNVTHFEEALVYWHYPLPWKGG